MKDEQSENREQSGTLGNLDADALQARMDWAQESPFEQTDKPEQPMPSVADPIEINKQVRRGAKRQLWIIAVCVLVVIAGAAAFSLRFGNLFSGKHVQKNTTALTGKEAPWLVFADGMLSWNPDYTKEASIDLIIPDTFDGEAVTGIADEGFSHVTQIASVTVGADVQQIGVRAFEGCTQLSDAVLGGVQELSYGAFSGCTSLVSVAGDDLLHIGAYAFQNCTALVSLPFGEKITSIGTCAFQNCGALGLDLILPDAEIGRASCRERV